MSLAVSLEQITKRSWMAEDVAQSARVGQGQDKRRMVMQAVEAAGRPVNCMFVVNATGLTKATVSYAASVLIEEGCLVKVHTISNRVLWKVAP